MVKKVGVAILGLGVVGGGTYQTLVEHHDFYLKTQQVDLTVEMVLDKALDRLKALNVPEECIAKSIEEVLANPNVDIVIETIGGIGVAKDFVTAALREGKTVVTSNKELICKYSHELEKLQNAIIAVFITKQAVLAVCLSFVPCLTVCKQTISKA